MSAVLALVRDRRSRSHPPGHVLDAGTGAITCQPLGTRASTLRHMDMTATATHRSGPSGWSLGLVVLGVGLTVLLAAFVGAVELTLLTGGTRLPAVAGVLVAVALLFIPGRWRWLALAWCLGLAAFGAFYLALASAPNYGDLLPG